MAEVLLYHHIQGLTDGVRAFADDAAEPGTPCTRPTCSAGDVRQHRRRLRVRAPGSETHPTRGDGAADELAGGLVYAGFSWGVGPAQRLAQTRAGARGALLYEACYPITGEYAFGPWPDGVPVQIHGKEERRVLRARGDIDAARELVARSGRAGELFVYPGGQHLFLDRSLPTYDAAPPPS